MHSATDQYKPFFVRQGNIVIFCYRVLSGVKLQQHWTRQSRHRQVNGYEQIVFYFQIIANMTRS